MPIPRRTENAKRLLPNDVRVKFAENCNPDLELLPPQLGCRHGKALQRDSSVSRPLAVACYARLEDRPLGVWVGEGLKEEIAGERGPRRTSQRPHDEKLWESFRSIPPAVLWFTYIKGVPLEVNPSTLEASGDALWLTTVGLRVLATVDGQEGGGCRAANLGCLTTPTAWAWSTVHAPL
eukprot:scaffold39689_cov36-Phaeocystis_antarctica.AAC.2